jgi:hypothetical protein
MQQVGTVNVRVHYPSAKSTIIWEYGCTEKGSVTNNAVIATMSLGAKIRYAGKTTCTGLGKRVLPMLYPQSPAATPPQMLAAALEKMRDVPEKYLREIGVAYGFAMKWKKCFCN